MGTFLNNLKSMGRARTKTVKRAARQLIENYYTKMTSDFHLNKKILSDVASIPTKRLRNKIAGFATHLMRRIQIGPVKGISLKIQEEERERRLDFVPEQSAINTERVAVVDQETIEMLKNAGPNLSSMLKVQTKVTQNNRGNRRQNNNRENRENRAAQE